MTQALRELVVSIDFDRVDVSRLTRMDRTIDQIERNLRDLGGDINRVGDRTREMGADGQRGLDRIRRAAAGAGDEIHDLHLCQAADCADDLADSGSDAADVLDDVADGGKLAGLAAEIFSNKWVLAGGAVLAAIGGIGVALFKMQADADEVFDRMQVNAGMNLAERANAEKVALSVYSKNYGEDLKEAAMGVATFSSAFKDTDTATLDKLTKGAFMLKDGFDGGPEIKETAKVIKTMTNNFDELSKTDALDLITFGFQNNANYADDFIDTLNEYSVHFAKIGIKADRFVGTLLNGAKAGAFNLDKIGDSVKEIGIQAIDAEGAAAEAFTSLGFNAKDMGQKWANGGAEGQKAFTATVAALSFVDDKVKQNKIGVQLFGAGWEDLREKVIFAMDGAEKAVVGFQGSTDRATTDLYNNVGSKWAIFWRTMKADVIQSMLDSGLSVDGFLDGLIARLPMIGDYIHAFVSGMADAFSNFGTIVDQLKAGDIFGAIDTSKAYRDIQRENVEKTHQAFNSIFQPIPQAMIGPPAPKTNIAQVTVQVTPPAGMTAKEAQDHGSIIGGEVDKRVLAIFNQLNTKFQN